MGVHVFPILNPPSIPLGHPSAPALSTLYHVSNLDWWFISLVTIFMFQLWCWRRLLTVPWTERRSNHSILKEISPGCSLEGLMLKLKLQYSGHLMWRADSFERILMLGRLRAGGEGDDREWYGWMASLTQWTWFWVNSGSWWWTGRLGAWYFMGLQRVGQDWETELNRLKTE